MSDITVVLDWDANPQLVVEPTHEGLHVVAHPGLSDDQVAWACDNLGDDLAADGPAVLRAWREAVGLVAAGGGGA